MMRSSVALAALISLAWASPAAQKCTNDACLVLIEDFTDFTTPFCAAYIKLPKVNNPSLPILDVENDCFLPSNLSSACSCLLTTSTTTKTSTTTTKHVSSSATTTSSKSSTKSSKSSTKSSKSTTKSSTSTTKSSKRSTSTPTAAPTTSSLISTSFTSSSAAPSSTSSSAAPSSTSSSAAPSSTSSSAAPSSTSSSAAPSSTSSSAAPSSTSSSAAPSSTSSSAAPSSTSSSAAPYSTSSSAAPSSISSSAAPTSTVSPCTSPAPGAVIVDNSANPISNSYPTVQQGVNALSLTSTTPQTLFIYPGLYTEQVYIPALKSPLTVQGYTLDCSTYTSNTATISYNLALINTTSDDLTATLRVWSPNTKIYNLNIANVFGHISKNGQNLAVSAHTGNQGYYGVQLLGYQDTLLANTGNQLYAKSLITGAVDFIFGQTATAWLEQVDIRTIAAGCVTASGRSTEDNPSWYVINNSTVDGINSTIAAGTNYLGRPWESFARVVFQNTYLGAIIKPAGWSVWSTSVNGSTNIGNVTFGEYGNYGPGSVLEEGPRADFSEQLDAPVLIEDILGAGYEDEWWVDMSYM